MLRQHYSAPLRLVRFFDVKHDRFLVFLADTFELPALMIAELYRSRWQVKLFFKWIKQHLRIKAFYGTSEHAVRSPIWFPVSVYLLVAIAKKDLKLTASLNQVLQVASVTLFERVPFLQALQFQDSLGNHGVFSNQLSLFDL